MRVHIEIRNNNVESCEVSGATGKDAKDLAEFLLDRTRAQVQPKPPAYPPGLSPVYISVDVLREAVQTVNDGNNKIRCIKMVRQLTGWGLKESKDFVDMIPVNTYLYQSR